MDSHVTSTGCGAMTGMVQQESSTRSCSFFLSLPEKSVEWWCGVKIAEVNCHFKVLSFSAEEVGERERERGLRRRG